MSDLLSHWIASLLRSLSLGLSTRVARDHYVEPVAAAALARVRRSLGRLSALLALFRDGRLPAPHQSGREGAGENREVAPRADAARRPAPMQLPRGRCWLLRLTGDQGEACAMAVRHLASEPEMEALLAATPQAGRLLRPLWHMLCHDPLPEALLAPRPAPSATRPRREVRIEACRGARLDAALARVLGGPPTRTRPPDRVDARKLA